MTNYAKRDLDRLPLLNTDIQCICCGSIQSPRSCKFSFLFWGGMIMNANEFETKNKIKFKRTIKFGHNIYIAD